MDWAEALAPGGIIARQMPGFETRPQQTEMAAAVTRAFTDGKHLLVEAGTGVGKSFAYLLPAIERVVEREERVVVSTHTIALQEQLVHKDIPFLRSALPNEFSVALVKGRSNYLGLRRLQRASQRCASLFDTQEQLRELQEIEEWAQRTTDGSRADLPFEPHPAVWERVRANFAA